MLYRRLHFDVLYCVVLCCFVLYYLLYLTSVILCRSTVWGDSTYTGKVNQHLSQKVTLFHPPLMTLSVIQSITLHRTSFPVHLNAHSCHLIYFVPSFFTISLSQSLSLWLFPTHSHSLTHTYTLSLTITYSLAHSLTRTYVRTYCTYYRMARIWRLLLSTLARSKTPSEYDAAHVHTHVHMYTVLTSLHLSYPSLPYRSLQRSNVFV